MSKTITGIVTWLKNWFPLKSELGAVAISNDYNDLDNKPTDMEHDCFYGTCTTSASVQTKSVTVDTSFNLKTGVMLNVKFDTAQTYNANSSNPVKLSINNGESKNVMTVGTTATSRYYWRSGELVSFVYDGTNWIIVDGGLASTTYYGITKLNNTISSTATDLSATANSVRLAYNRGTSAYELAETKADANHNHNIWNLTQENSSGINALQDEGDGYCNLFGKLFYSYSDDSLYYNNYDSNSELATKNDIPNLTNYVQKSQTTGLIKNDGTIMQSGTGASNFALGNHTHTKSQITDFPTIPSKTSDLTNDGTDGTNIFVSNNDSRLSDNRNPSSHNLAPTSTHLVDLDNVRGTGFYYALGNSNIQYVSNLPSNWGDTSFYLTVEETNNSTYCKQTITSYGGDKMLVRTKWGSGWTVWKSCISDLNNMSTVAVTVTYTDDTTETINLVKYTGS